jgi:hypothetical protein
MRKNSYLSHDSVFQKTQCMLWVSYSVSNQAKSFYVYLKTFWVFEKSEQKEKMNSFLNFNFNFNFIQ